MDRLPLWFIEGMAEYLSIGPVDPNTAMWIRDAARQEMLPEIKDLNNPKYFPYRWGQAVWAYIGGRYGDRAVGPDVRYRRASAPCGRPRRWSHAATNRCNPCDLQTSLETADPADTRKEPILMSFIEPHAS